MPFGKLPRSFSIRKQEMPSPRWPALAGGGGGGGGGRGAAPAAGGGPDIFPGRPPSPPPRPPPAGGQEIDARSEPVSGSESALALRNSPRATRGKYFAFISSDMADLIQPPCPRATMDATDIHPRASCSQIRQYSK